MRLLYAFVVTAIVILLLTFISGCGPTGEGECNNAECIAAKGGKPGAGSTSKAQLSPTSLAFTSYTGANPNSQTVTITTTGGKNAKTVSWTADIVVGVWGEYAGGPWITVTPAVGTTPSSIQVGINVYGLMAGTYDGRIDFTFSDNTQLSLPVTLTLTDMPSPPPPATGSATLVWDPIDYSTMPSGVIVDHINVYMATSSILDTAPRGFPQYTLPAGDTIFTETSGYIGTTYYFRITYVSTEGAESGYSNEVFKTYQ